MHESGICEGATLLDPDADDDAILMRLKEEFGRGLFVDYGLTQPRPSSKSEPCEQSVYEGGKRENEGRE